MRSPQATYARRTSSRALHESLTPLVLRTGPEWPDTVCDRRRCFNADPWARTGVASRAMAPKAATCRADHLQGWERGVGGGENRGSWARNSLIRIVSRGCDLALQRLQFRDGGWRGRSWGCGLRAGLADALRIRLGWNWMRSGSLAKDSRHHGDTVARHPVDGAAGGLAAPDAVSVKGSPPAAPAHHLSPAQAFSPGLH